MGNLLGNNQSDPPPAPRPATTTKPTPKKVPTTTTKKPTTTTRPTTTIQLPTTISTTTSIETTTIYTTTSLPDTTRFMTGGKGDANAQAGIGDPGGTTTNSGTNSIGYLAAVGGVLGLLVIAVIFGVYVWRRSRSKPSKHKEHTDTDTELTVRGAGGSPPSTGVHDPSYTIEEEEKDSPPLYTQVNKEKKTKLTQNGSQTTPGDDNPSHEVPTVSDNPPTKNNPATELRPDNEINIDGTNSVSYYNLWSDSKTVVVKGQPVEANSKEGEMKGRVAYENCAPIGASEEVTYEVGPDFEPSTGLTGDEPDAPTGNTYDKLDRLDITNEDIMGENEYDL